MISHDLDLVREQRKAIIPERSGTIKGDLEALDAGEKSDHYVLLHKKEQEQEQKQEQKQEEKNEEDSKGNAEEAKNNEQDENAK